MNCSMAGWVRSVQSKFWWRCWKRMVMLSDKFSNRPFHYIIYNNFHSCFAMASRISWKRNVLSLVTFISTFTIFFAIKKLSMCNFLVRSRLWDPVYSDPKTFGERIWVICVIGFIFICKSPANINILWSTFSILSSSGIGFASSST